MLYSLLLKIGGKGLFVKELENVLLDGCVDLVVYFMKDVLIILLLELGLFVIM